MGKTVAIIILNWNAWRDTIACVESCLQLDYPDAHILLVDNGSTDGSENTLRNRFPELEFIQTGSNLGYAGGNNVGIRRALEKPFDFVWLLNNDTVVDPECLAKMVEIAETDPRVGMVGSKIYYHHAPKTIWYAGGTVDLEGGGLTRHVGQDEEDADPFNQLRETEYITGCSLLARKEMIETVGLLEEAYFLYFEDADWSLRASRQGWKLLYQPAARLWHKEGARNQKTYSPHFIYYFLRNRFFFVTRFAPRRMFRCQLLQIKTALFFIKEAFAQNLTAGFRTCRPIWQAYCDYFLRRQMGFKADL